MYRFAVAASIVLSLLGSPAIADGEEENLPSMEFLEFLADWSDDDGEWLDPVDLEKMNLPEQEHKEDDTK